VSLIAIGNKLTIILKNRKDYSTLLHELKHLDLFIKNNGKHFKNYIFRSRQVVDRSLANYKEMKILKQILYVYDKDEFEAKYHSYYVDIDNYLQNNIKRIKNKELVKNLMEEFLNNEPDKSYTWWVGYFDGKKTNREFNFSNYLSNDNINKFFFIINKEKMPIKYSFKETFKEIFSDILDVIKIKFNKYSKKEIDAIQKTRKEYEKEINKRKNIFRKKFFRLFSIMTDKYGK